MYILNQVDIPFKLSILTIWNLVYITNITNFIDNVLITHVIFFIQIILNLNRILILFSF